MYPAISHRFCVLLYKSIDGCLDPIIHTDRCLKTQHFDRGFTLTFCQNLRLCRDCGYSSQIVANYRKEAHSVSLLEGDKRKLTPYVVCALSDIDPNVHGRHSLFVGANEVDIDTR